jgi:hypothetical protein
VRIQLSGVSARGCSVAYEGGTRFRVADLASSNGTFVRGRRIESAELRDGEFFSPAMPAIRVELSLGWKGQPWPPLLESSLGALLAGRS